MPDVLVGVGSNIEPARYIGAALDRLGDQFGELHLSPVYESAAIGFSGAAFLNLVVGFDTALAVPELAAALRLIECDNGYRVGAPKFSPRTLDLDLLLYGDLCLSDGPVQLPRADITEYAYVLWPLADLVGAGLHPQLKISYADLKRQFRPIQQLEKVPFVWRGRNLSA